MARKKPPERLAEALETLHHLQEQGHVAIRSAQLSRLHRERLVKNGFLKEVMKGWHIPTRPDERAGESTSWFASYWHFCAEYLHRRFGTNWCLSPEQSVLLHVGNKTVPQQLLVRSTKARNQITRLIHGTALLEVRLAIPDKTQTYINEDKLRLYSLPFALVNCAEGFFTQHKTDSRAALAMLRTASDILQFLLEGGNTTVAGRLAGAFRNIGRTAIADDILNGMRAAGYEVRENDPFKEKAPFIIPSKELSPYVNRLRLMWQAMRPLILDIFPESPGVPKNTQKYLKEVAGAYALDAYNSLSIEGYGVTPDLIERVRKGKWAPDLNEDDRKNRDAMAARGYWQAYQQVQKSVAKVLQGKNAGQILENDHGTWYRELFAPSVVAGILKPSDLAGYRNSNVYIRHSMHTPPAAQAVRDLMPAFFELLSGEEEAAVRVVLGHFIFVYIHPYMDGNGRMARFLMNTMMASGGYPWTIVPVEKRDAYMSALEQASVKQNIKPFATFLASLMA